tara:strand:+ start:390 stop:731 length:342 start_codon:yes stop_codon:yes gene_type:complete
MIILLDRNDLREEYKERPAEEISLFGAAGPRMFFLKMETITTAHVICFHCNVEERWFILKSRVGKTGELKKEEHKSFSEEVAKYFKDGVREIEIDDTDKETLSRFDIMGIDDE